MATTKRTPIEPKTAAEALAIRAEQADRLLVSIRTQCEELITKNREAADWGHAGSLSHVVSKLREIDAFLRGEDVNEDPGAE